MFTTEELRSMLDPSVMGSPSRIESLRRQEHKRLRKIAMRTIRAAGVKEWVFHDDGLHGRAYPKSKKIIVPTPTTPRHLYVVARQCGRIVFHDVTPTYMRDLQVERYACSVLRNNQLPLPHEELAKSQRQLARKICLAARRGVKEFDDQLLIGCRGEIWTEIQELSRQSSAQSQ